MTYTGKVENGVVVFDGEIKPRDGMLVRVEEVATTAEVGDALDRLAGKAVGLPPDLADRHDHYRREQGAL